jgi:single-strand DNA-binding protein
MNKVLMMGRLTRDPEVRYSNEGNAVSKFNLAVDRRYKREGQPDADFFNCVAFGKTAEFTEKYLKKGTKVVLEGELQNNNYTNKDGQKVYGMQIVVNSLEFAESKSSSNSDRDSTQQVDSNDFMNVPDVAEEELPFA